jgi:hypothetical protein
MKNGIRRRVLGAAAVAAAAFVAAPLAFGANAFARTGYNTVPVHVARPGGGFGLERPLSLVDKNVDVTKRTGAQSETAIASDPTDATHLLAFQNDLTDTARLYESHDSGKTWGPSGLNLDPSFCYDPWIDFNAAGDAFVSYECSNESLAYRKHGTTTWVKQTFGNAGGFPDRDMDVVDTTPSSPFFNSVYIGYDDNGNNNTAYVLYSRDGFTNYTRSPKINTSGGPTIGVNAAVAPNGTVYATWEDYSGKKIWTASSTNGGATWSVNHLVHNYRLNTTGFWVCSVPAQASRCLVPFPMTTVAPAGSPNAGRLYAVYMDKDPVTADTNTYLRYSDDGGVTWSGEVLVNDDTNHAYQFHPSISVAPNGTVGVSFYDTRTDPAGKKTNRVIAFSTDGGATFGPNIKVTTHTSDETTAFDPNQYGDYQNSDASVDNLFYLTWTDDRQPQGAEEQFSARVQP